MLAVNGSSDNSSCLMVEDAADKDGTGGSEPESGCEFDSADDETEEKECSTDCIRPG